jgi:Ca2+-binding EF-hand superfamily protein
MNSLFDTDGLGPAPRFILRKPKTKTVSPKPEFLFMRKRPLIIATGVLLAAGAVVAISAPGPRGHRGDAWEHGGQLGEQMEGGGRRGIRGWLGPRSITSDDYDAKTRERFARLDKNSDGVLDATEIEAAVKERTGGRHGREAARGGGDRADGFLRMFGDKDGKVTKDAFLVDAKRRFTQMDLNNDGKITDEDLPPMMRGKGVLKADGPSGPGVMGPMGRMIADLRTADTKNEGIITIEAYLAINTKRFDELDRNKDGVVDKADIEAMRKEMTDYQVKRFIHAYGADSAGKISREQFYAVAKERFARLDRKGEGKITFGRGDEPSGRPWGGRGRGERGPAPDGAPERGSPPPPKN